MTEPPDDTPQTPPPPPRPDAQDKPASYYYDDATGYELFDPEADHDEQDGAQNDGDAPKPRPV
ncbi:MAG TPA: hypothetical protein VGB73_20250 [Pyrinomonadaceae bacterium]|jgi:hypothetical protein